MNTQEVLQHPEAIRFSANHVYRDTWSVAGGRVVEQSTGHHVFYGSHGQRILLADPDGQPLHECWWTSESSEVPILLAARIRLDWGQWVGIQPGNLVNTISIDLSKRPGWENLTRQDLRKMAARAMNVDTATIEFFYRDDDLELRDDGTATIRQIKDAFYVLPEGSFERAEFMSCMSRMEWGKIDYLPVVELFLSLLPGTGSATFELIRGLYDDQQVQVPIPLHYRGIPAYPSVGAFRLFSAFFTPSIRSGEPPLNVFLDVHRAHEIEWYPSPQHPVRYIDEQQRVGVTIYQHNVQKVTCWDDSTGLSYLAATASGEAQADGRIAQVSGHELCLFDGKQSTVMHTRASWQLAPDDHARKDFKPAESSWRDCFPLGPPEISSKQAFAAVLLYPDDEKVIGEKESQPFIFDYLEDFLEQHTELAHFRETAEHFLLVGCEASLGACLKYERPQRYTIWYEWPEFAQKQAQRIWNSLHRQNALAWLPHFQFFPVSQQAITNTYSPFDWMNVWIPFAVYEDPKELRQWSWFLANHLVPGGIGCVAGPATIGHLFQEHGLSGIHVEKGELLPTLKIHQAILQASRLHPELTIWIVQQS